MSTPHAHRVAGVYATEQEAQSAYQGLIRQGFLPPQLSMIRQNPKRKNRWIESNRTLWDIFKYTAIGTVVGGAFGLLGQIIITIADIDLFIASPFVGPVFMIGWGAMVGAFVGGGIAISSQESQFADFVNGAINDSYVVLVAYTRSEQETRKAEQLIGHSSEDRSEMYISRA